MLAFLWIFFFWNLDKRCRSYELFSLPCFFCLIMHFFPFYRFSCFFYFWKMPLTSYPFNFLLLLTLEPFTLCFILIELSVQCICNGLFLQQKLTSHLVLPHFSSWWLLVVAYRLLPLVPFEGMHYSHPFFVDVIPYMPLSSIWLYRC